MRPAQLAASTFPRVEDRKRPPDVARCCAPPLRLVCVGHFISSRTTLAKGRKYVELAVDAT
jgi:hypothetical protein